MFISQALASTGTQPAGGDFFMSLMPIILIFIVFYFLLLRPQQKRIKEHRNVIDNLSKGDQVVTGGGVVAVVKQVKNENELVLELAKGVEVTVVRSTIQGVWTSPVSLKASTNDDVKKTEKKTPAKKAPAKKATAKTTKKK